jgi:hypothetical protein
MCFFFFNLDSEPIERTSNSELTKVTKVPTSPTRHYASVSSSTPPPESLSHSVILESAANFRTQRTIRHDARLLLAHLVLLSICLDDVN